MYDIRDLLDARSCNDYCVDGCVPGIASLVVYDCKLGWTDVSLDQFAQAIVDTGLLPDIYATGGSYTYDSDTNVFNLIIQDNDVGTPDFNILINFCEVAVDCINDELVKIAAGTANGLAGFCGAVARCITDNGLPAGVNLFTLDGNQVSVGSVVTTAHTLGLDASYLFTSIVNGVTATQSLASLVGVGAETDNILIPGGNGKAYLTCEMIQDCIGLAAISGVGITYDDVNDSISVAVSNMSSCTLLNAITTPVANASGYRIPIMNGTTCGYILFDTLLPTCSTNAVSTTNPILTKDSLSQDTVLPASIVATPDPTDDSIDYIKAEKRASADGCGEDIYVPDSCGKSYYVSGVAYDFGGDGLYVFPLQGLEVEPDIFRDPSQTTGGDQGAIVNGAGTVISANKNFQDYIEYVIAQSLSAGQLTVTYVNVYTGTDGNIYGDYVLEANQAFVDASGEVLTGETSKSPEKLCHPPVNGVKTADNCADPIDVLATGTGPVPLATDFVDCSGTPLAVGAAVLTPNTLTTNTDLPVTVLDSPDPTDADNQYIKAEKVNTGCGEEIYVPVISNIPVSATSNNSGDTELLNNGGNPSGTGDDGNARFDTSISVLTVSGLYTPPTGKDRYFIGNVQTSALGGGQNVDINWVQAFPTKNGSIQIQNPGGGRATANSNSSGTQTLLNNADTSSHIQTIVSNGDVLGVNRRLRISQRGNNPVPGVIPYHRVWITGYYTLM